MRSYCCSGCLFAGKGYDEKTASIAAIIFIFIPWNIMWFGRAQTDPLITALMTLAIALCVRAYKNGKSMLPFGIILGLAVFTKQPALAALPIVLIWSYFQGVKSILLKNPYRMNL
ncbi:MAG: glycosyltransferase family 39 protein [Euryarchaeota archaeon]|nr:glycosyltransferase family 39 protein [Euryarchaeota archaeon]